MTESKLNPFDAELLVMIGDISKSQPEVDENPDRYEITVDTTEMQGKSIEALKQAVAEQLIEPLEKAIADMKARPEYYEQFNSPNGWGTYKDFVPWLEKYLAACKEYPDAVVEVSR